MKPGPNAAAGGAQALLVGTVCYMLASLFWGMNIPMTAILFRTFDPIFMAPLRVSIGALVLLALVLAMHGPRALGAGTSLGRMATMTLAMAGFYILYNLGLRYTNTITAAAIMAGSPVYTALILRVLFRTPLEPGFWVAAGLTLLGAGIAIWGRAGDTGQSLALQGGEPLILLSMVCWAMYSIWSQRWFDPAVPQLRRTYAALVGSALWLFVFWLFARRHRTRSARPGSTRSPTPSCGCWSPPCSRPRWAVSPGTSASTGSASPQAPSGRTRCRCSRC